MDTTMKHITIGRALIITAMTITVIVFLKNWYPGMFLEFFRSGHPFDRLALALFVPYWTKVQYTRLMVSRYFPVCVSRRG